MVIRLFSLSVFLVACAAVPQAVKPPLGDIADSPQSQESAPPVAPVPPLWQLSASGEGLQHIASGYICRGQIDDFVMIGDEAYPGLGHGNDVACVYASSEGMSVKLHLTNFGRMVSPSAHLKGAKTSIADAYSLASEADVPPMLDAPDIAYAAAFRLATPSKLRPDVPVHTAVWIEQIGPWHIKARATYEADRAQTISTVITALYASAYTNLENPARLALPETLTEAAIAPLNDLAGN